MEKPQEVHWPAYLKIACIFISIALGLYALTAAKMLFVPLVLAMLFAFLLLPVTNALERWGVPRILAIVVCLVLVLEAVVGLVAFFSYQVASFAADLPLLQMRVMQKYNEFVDLAAHIIGVESEQVSAYFRERGQDMIGGAKGPQLIANMLQATSTTLAMLGLLPIFIFFLLFYREKLRVFVLKVAKEPYRAKAVTIMDNIQDVSRAYIGGMLIVMVILAIMNTLGLLIIGIPYAFLLGIIAALLNIIPYIGPTLGGLLPFLIALLVKDTVFPALGVVGLIMFNQFLENNILTPWITGAKVSVNPLATIIALIVGGAVWGVAGMIIFIPLVGMLKVVFDNIDSLRPYGYLIGTEGANGANGSAAASWLGRLKNRKGKGGAE